jgi:hypothetical protein
MPTGWVDLEPGTSKIENRHPQKTHPLATLKLDYRSL